MLKTNLEEENLEIKNKAYKLYEKHGFKNGNDFIDWLEAEKQSGKFGTRKKWAKLSRLGQSKRMINIYLFIIGFLCVIIVILLFMLFNRNSRIAIAEKNLSDLKVMMLVLDPNAVRGSLIEKGIVAERITTNGYGSSINHYTQHKIKGDSHVTETKIL